MSGASKTVLICDDDQGMRDTIAAILRRDYRILTVSSGESALTILKQEDVDVLLLDVRLPGISGFDVLRIVKENYSLIECIMISAINEVETAVQAMKHGALDFLTKPVNDEDLLSAVRMAIEKDSALRREQSERSEIRARLATLTPREREVLEYVVAGKLNKQIAGDLGIVEQTVKFHRARIMERMQARTVAELMHLAARLGIGRDTPVRRNSDISPGTGRKAPQP